MHLEQKYRRTALAVIVSMILLRIVGGDFLMTALTTPEAAALMMYLETGHVIRPGPLPSADAEDPITPSEETTAPEDTRPQSDHVAVFAPEDAQLVEVNSVCGYEADVQTYLNQALHWDLKQDEPTVLIVHSHATEGYQNTIDGNYRTKSLQDNVVSIGDRLVQVLEIGGVHVIHDRTLHDSPSYSDAYGNARKSIADLLEKYPTVQLVLDIHRDSVADQTGEQMAFAVQHDGQRIAQLMMVVGTDAGGLTHPNWPENMSMAVKLHAQLEKNCPGICRPISFRSQRFNQDLSPGAVIVEVGATGNTHQEAILAVEQLGQAIIDLAEGTAADN